LLIIGGRYGSTTAEGISYTEKEYDYAIEKGMKVIALLHEKPEEISVAKSETNPKSKKRLVAFRDKVKKNRLVRFWNSAEKLPGLVALSLQQTIKRYPAVGWIRGDKASSNELLNEVNELRKKKEELESKLAELQKASIIEIYNLAGLDESIMINGEYRHNGTIYPWEFEITWREIFELLSPYLLQPLYDIGVSAQLTKALFEEYSKRNQKNILHKISSNWTLDDQIFNTIKIQLQALKLVNLRNTSTKQGVMLYWVLTDRGNALMMNLRTVKSQKTPLTETLEIEEN